MRLFVQLFIHTAGCLSFHSTHSCPALLRSFGWTMLLYVSAQKGGSSKRWREEDSTLYRQYIRKTLGKVLFEHSYQVPQGTLKFRSYHCHGIQVVGVTVYHFTLETLYSGNTVTKLKYNLFSIFTIR